MPKRHGKNGKQAARAREVELQVFDLLKRGYNQSEIAEQIHHLDPDGKKAGTYSQPGVGKIIRRVIQELRAATLQDAAEVVAVEVSRIDSMIGVLWPLVLQGDLLAMDRVIRLMKRRAEMLGLDAPPKVNPGDPNAVEAITRVIGDFVSKAAG